MRKVDAVLGACRNQANANGIFTNYSRNPSLSQACDDFFPGLAAVTRAEEIRVRIPTYKNSGESGVGIVSGGLYRVNGSALGKPGRRNIVPGHAITRDLDLARRTAHPNEVDVQRRRCNRLNERASYCLSSGLLVVIAEDLRGFEIILRGNMPRRGGLWSFHFFTGL